MENEDKYKVLFLELKKSTVQIYKSRRLKIVLRLAQIKLL